ncbi:hypothetical protein Agub_g5920 [Astrephomene gubernaculifera]|uniref:Uncharacterized protein n=1 Tax=Astrephomene gubernaculifera TaxID=47775 RepID=A0AAD3HL11_9CHLO|nr:hypothetical protein Agub_g5920 [Astrephomene gubernaculifera]
MPPGSFLSSGRNGGALADEALNTLRSNVTTQAREGYRPPFSSSRDEVGKAFQSAHKSTGWDRKARTQRAENMARSAMGITGMDDSLNNWSPSNVSDPMGADRRGGGGPLMGARLSTSSLAGGGGGSGTIAELRTPVALKEHLKRGKGAREAGIQLITLDAVPGEEPPPLEQAAALAAAYEQRRTMLGTPSSPCRQQMLTPTDRARRAWTNYGNANSILLQTGNGDVSGGGANPTTPHARPMTPRRFSDTGTASGAAGGGGGGGTGAAAVGMNSHVSGLPLAFRSGPEPNSIIARCSADKQHAAAGQAGQAAFEAPAAGNAGSTGTPLFSASPPLHHRAFAEPAVTAVSATAVAAAAAAAKAGQNGGGGSGGGGGGLYPDALTGVLVPLSPRGSNGNLADRNGGGGGGGGGSAAALGAGLGGCCISSPPLTASLEPLMAHKRRHVP